MAAVRVAVQAVVRGAETVAARVEAATAAAVMEAATVEARAEVALGVVRAAAVEEGVEVVKVVAAKVVD